MSYKCELHCHMNYSGCSEVSAADTVQKYVDKGYTTLVVTNHFNPHHFRRDGSFETLVRGTFDAFEETRAAAGDRLHVLMGMELTFNYMPNDFLLYGIDEKFITDIGEKIFDLRLWELRDMLNEIGGLIIQAHPFRYGQTVVNPADVHGIEIFNGHTGQHSHNEVAKHWALYWMEHHRNDGTYILTSGSDHHHTWQYPVAGIETDEPITTMDELLSVLKSCRFTRITASLGEKDY